MKMLFIYITALLFFDNFSAIADASTNSLLDIEISNVRHSYYRDETVKFEIVILNIRPVPVKNVTVSIELEPLKPVKKTFILDEDKIITVPYSIKCSTLKPGDYSLKVSAELNGKIEEKQFDLFISQQPNPQRLSVHYWVPLNYWVPGDDRLTGSLGLLNWGQKHGFNTFLVTFIGKPPSDDIQTDRGYMGRLFEEAVKKRINLGLYFSLTNSALYEEHPEVFVVPHDKKGSDIFDNQLANDVCLNEPYVIEYAEKSVRASMKTFGIYPSFYHSLINTEFRSDPCYSEDCIERLKLETGLDLYNYNVDPLHPPKTEELAKKAGLPEKLVKAVPRDGIIEDDNPYYQYYMWWWKRGMGDALLNERISDIIKEYKNDVITWHDPFRLAPIYGRHKGLDLIGQWTYTFPDPKYTAYAETLITGTKPEQQMFMPDITVWEYENWLAPTDSGVVIMPPHILRENCWIALSRRPDIICHYIPTDFNPQKDIDGFHRDPKSFEMMAWMSENVYKPYGPMILQTKRTPRKAAILSSASSILFPEINRGGYTNKAIYPFYSLLMMAHIPTDVIFDETITRYGLDKYNILFLHQCETLTRSVYEKILEFERRGGIVIGDKLLRADIPLQYRCGFDLDHRKRQFADLILEGKGVTADEDRELMTKYANELRRVLDGKVERFVDSDSPEVLFNVLRNGPVKYVFMINDKRTYGEIYGQKWKTFHEEGVAQSVTASIKVGEKTPVIYDLREHRAIPAERVGDKIWFARKLGPCDGTIIAVYPNPIEKVNLDSPVAVQRGETGLIAISVEDSEGKSYGSQPIFIRITDSSGSETDYTDNYATEDGEYRIEIIPALNDLTGIWKVSVRDLTSGIEAFSTFEVK